MNKKGQELTIGTLILIVLGIVILVMVILGFAIGWENLFEKIRILPGGTSIASKVSSCRIAVSSSTNYDYCKFDKLKTDTGILYANCDYTPVKADLEGSGLTCATDAEKAKCTELSAVATASKNAFDADKITVNGKTCTSLGVISVAKP